MQTHSQALFFIVVLESFLDKATKNKNKKMLPEHGGGALLSAFFEVLFDRLASRQVMAFLRGRDFDQTLFHKLKTALLTVNAVIIHAEENQITNLVVREWINELKDATYNADDLLDELATIALRGELEAEAKANEKQVAPGHFSVLNPHNQESMLKKN